MEVGHSKCIYSEEELASDGILDYTEERDEETNAEKVRKIRGNRLSPLSKVRKEVEQVEKWVKFNMIEME